MREAGRGKAAGKPLLAMAQGKATAPWLRKLMAWLPEGRLINAWVKTHGLISLAYWLENMIEGDQIAQEVLESEDFQTIRTTAMRMMDENVQRLFARPFARADNVWIRTIGTTQGQGALHRRERALVAAAYEEMMSRFGGTFDPPPSPFPRYSILP